MNKEKKLWGEMTADEKIEQLSCGVYGLMECVSDLLYTFCEHLQTKRSDNDIFYYYCDKKVWDNELVWTEIPLWIHCRKCSHFMKFDLKEHSPESKPSSKGFEGQASGYQKAEKPRDEGS